MNSNLKNIYDSISYLSLKYDTYFNVYEELLSKYCKKDITLVEVGILNGGSLFMWREYLGKNARIIGIDLNPEAKIWEKEGFEIYIGNQGEENFWIEFYKKVGQIDILIDDGGHTNKQQIVTSNFAIKNIRDGGILIIEDVHTSYFREFGNPSKYSFINFAKCLVDGINSRSYALRDSYKSYSSKVYSVSFYESIVAMHINSNNCIRSNPIKNNGISMNVSDFRYQGYIKSIIFSWKYKTINNSKSIPKIFFRVLNHSINLALSIFAKIEIFKYIKYFKK